MEREKVDINETKKVNWEKWGVIISLLSLLIALFGIQISCNFYECSEKEETITSPTDATAVEPEFPQLTNLSVGDHFLFGSYEQDNNLDNGAEPIEWRVLDIRDDGSALVISEYSLDAVQYNEEYVSVTWETSTLRNWLNRDFYNTAFSFDEKQLIIEMTLSNPDNTDYETDGGADTRDKVFCLSIDEAQSYFSDVADRKCKPTDYVIAKPMVYYDDYGWWWLRSPGEYGSGAADVGSGGGIHLRGHGVHDDMICVRPAFYIDLNQ